MASYTVRDESGRIVVSIAGTMDRLRQRLPIILKEMSTTLLTLVQHGIQQEQSPDGTPWEPLKPATVKQRGSAHPILRRSGDLYRSLQPGETSNSAFVGTNWPYARIHQFGGVIKRQARTTTLYFKQYRDGTVGNRFVRRSQSNFSQSASVGAHEIVMPARPYLFTADGRTPESWQKRMTSIVLRHLKGAV